MSDSTGFIPVECAVIILQYLNNINQFHQLITINPTWNTACKQSIAYKHIELVIDMNRLPTFDYLQQCELCRTVCIGRGTSQYANNHTNLYQTQRVQRMVQYIVNNCKYIIDLSIDKHVMKCLSSTLHLSLLSRLSRLSMQYDNITCNDLLSISQCRLLEQLTIDIHDWTMYDCDVTPLSTLLQCSKLHTLTIGGLQYNNQLILTSLKQYIHQSNIQYLNVCIHNNVDSPDYIDTLSSIHCVDTVELLNADKLLIKCIAQLQCNTLTIQSCRTNNLSYLRYMRCQNINLYYCNGNVCSMIEPLIESHTISLDCCRFKSTDANIDQLITKSNIKCRNVEFNGHRTITNW